MFLSKFQLEMLYNKANVYGLGQNDEVEIVNKSNVWLYNFNQKKVIHLKWRPDMKDWVESK